MQLAEVTKLGKQAFAGLDTVVAHLSTFFCCNVCCIALLGEVQGQCSASGACCYPCMPSGALFTIGVSINGMGRIQALKESGDQDRLLPQAPV